MRKTEKNRQKIVVHKTKQNNRKIKFEKLQY